MNISAELAEISFHGGFFAPTVGGGGCLDLINATLERYRTTESRIGASLVHLGHAARLWSPVLVCVLSHGAIPDLTDLQRADDGARLRLPEPISEPVDRDSPSEELLYRVVVHHHMEPLEAGLRAKLAPALLSGNIASALVGASQALLSVRPDLRDGATGLSG